MQKERKKERKKKKKDRQKDLNHIALLVYCASQQTDCTQDSQAHTQTDTHTDVRQTGR